MHKTFLVITFVISVLLAIFLQPCGGEKYKHTQHQPMKVTKTVHSKDCGSGGGLCATQDYTHPFPKEKVPPCQNYLNYGNGI